MSIKNKIYQLLIQTQQYTKTDNIYLAKQGSYLYIGQFISFIIGFLMAMAYAKFLPKQIFGQFNYILTVLEILAITSLVGMTTAVIQAVARGYEGGFIKAVKIKLKWAFIGSGAALVMGGYYFWQGNKTLGWSCLIIAIFLPVTKSFILYVSFLQGKKIFSKSIQYQNTIRLISALTVFITIFYTNNLIVLLLTYFISNSLFNFIFHLWTLKKYPPNQKEDKRTIQYGKTLSFINIIPTIGKYIDRMIVFHFLGAPMLAIYHFALLPLNKTTALLQNIRKLALPKFAASNPEQLRATLLKKILKLFLIIIPGVILFIIIAPYAYQAFFPQYLESINYSRWLFLSILSFPFTFIAAGFNAQMKKMELLKLTTSTNIVYITCLLLLIPFYGIQGLIAAYLIKVFFNSALSVYLFRKL